MVIRKTLDLGRNFLKWCYDYMLDLSSRPNAMYFLFVFAFVESSFFPIPPYVMVIPMVLASPEKAWKIAGLATFASVLGGFLGYLIGIYAFDLIAEPMLKFYGYMPQFEEFKAYYNKFGAGIILMSTLTPFPYKVITITSGVMHMDLWVFGLASIVARGLRFFVIAWLLRKYGEPIKVFIEDHLGKLSMLFLALLVGGFYMIKLL